VSSAVAAIASLGISLEAARWEATSAGVASLGSDVPRSGGGYCCVARSHGLPALSLTSSAGAAGLGSLGCAPPLSIGRCRWPRRGVTSLSITSSCVGGCSWLLRLLWVLPLRGLKAMRGGGTAVWSESDGMAAGDGSFEVGALLQLTDGCAATSLSVASLAGGVTGVLAAEATLPVAEGAWESIGAGTMLSGRSWMDAER